ncbi:MAG TPA: response regulator [Edaphobacter sp.]|jgi:CheY-like chemotaxis protein|nr:response regulator [Edaphobacter sp.]
MAEHQRLRVLVVDDDAMMRELLSLLLIREGYGVDLAVSGEEALGKLQAGSSSPDLVLADLQMPGISGKAFVDAVHEQCNGLRIIAMSGNHVDKEDLGAVEDFLRKPFTIEALNNLLANEDTSPPGKNEIASNSRILNEQVYSQLAERMNAQKLTELYALCLTDTKMRIARMREAAHHNDQAMYRRQAHAIKGSCGMVGALELESLAATLEETQLTTASEAALDDLLRACNRFESMLVEHKNMVQEIARRSHA